MQSLRTRPKQIGKRGKQESNAENKRNLGETEGRKEGRESGKETLEAGRTFLNNNRNVPKSKDKSEPTKTKYKE